MAGTSSNGGNAVLPQAGTGLVDAGGEGGAALGGLGGEGAATPDGSAGGASGSAAEAGAAGAPGGAGGGAGAQQGEGGSTEGGASGAPTCSPKVRWARNFGGSHFDQGSAIALDASGGVAVAGYFGGTINFGGDTLSTTPDTDVFVARFDENGDHVFSRSLSSNGINAAYAVAIDSAGGVVATGYVRGTVDFGDGPVTGSSQATNSFLVKYDAKGKTVFGKRFVGTGEGHGVTTDDERNIVSVGWAAPGTDFGGGPTAKGNGYVAKYAADGTYQWSKHFGASYGVYPYAVRVAGSGNIVVAGSVSGPVDFGGGAVGGGGGDDVFLLILDASGNHVFSAAYGGADTQSGYGMDLDGQDRIYLAGPFLRSIDLGGGALDSAGSYDAFTAKFAAGGTFQKGRRYGDAQSQVVWNLASNVSGTHTLVGTATGLPDFGGGPLASQGLGDVFFARFDADGNHLCSQIYGDNAQQGGYGVAANATSIALTGFAYGDIDFGSGSLHSAGSADVFVAVLDTAK